MHTLAAMIATPALALATAAASPAQATEQYLPWRHAVAQVVTQGNHGAYSHNSATTRYGWDFALAFGTGVRASAGGEVWQRLTGCDGRRSPACNLGYGNTIVIRTEQGICHRYEHLASVRRSLELGTAVDRYEPLGRAGSSGDANGPHLHFQREDCMSGRALASRFTDAGRPKAGATVRSGNRPPRD